MKLMAMKISDVIKIRYIKLGEGGKWAKDCFEQKIIRLGYSSGTDEVFDLASNKNWSGVEKYWQKNGKTVGVSKNFTNQIKDFFTDEGSTLWVTFEDGYLYYCLSDGDAVQPDKKFPNANATSYLKAKNGWKNIDAKGNLLIATQLSGMITKTQAYRGTICQFSPQPEADNYIKNRISGTISKSVYEAEAAKQNLLDKVKPLILSLTPKDFEILCDLIFSNSGWRRTSKTGGTQKTIDMELQNPVTGDTAFVQVKTKTTSKEFESYVNKKRSTNYDRMFYVYHTGEIKHSDIDVDISVWNLEKVAQQVINNGLVDWVISHSK
jgi:hypothetical protein